MFFIILFLALDYASELLRFVQKLIPDIEFYIKENNSTVQVEQIPSLVLDIQRHLSTIYEIIIKRKV